MEIIRICQFCGNEFIARKTVTKYCSLKCASMLCLWFYIESQDLPNTLADNDHCSSPNIIMKSM